MIKIINDIQQDIIYIKIDTINNSFLYCDISQKHYGSQDDFFKWPDVDYSVNSNDDFKIINDLE